MFIYKFTLFVLGIYTNWTLILIIVN